MSMLSLRRRLGMTPSDDRGYDPAAAGWLDWGQQGAGQPAFVPRQRAGGYPVREHERADYAAGDDAVGDHGASAHWTHPLEPAERLAAPSPGPESALAPLAGAQPIEQPTRPGGAWPDICDQFGRRMLVLTEQLRASINELEAGEEDPERLWRLYRVDHAVTRMRLASRQLRTLAGRSERQLAGFTTSLLDVIRMAASAIERYTQVSVGRVTDLAVLGYAADDVAALIAALLDNATRYSPGPVTVSCHLLQEGGVMFRIEDAGSGLGPDQVATLNAIFAGPVPEVDEQTARHTGFPVVHRIARKHSIGVRLAARPLPGCGTVAMVLLPPQLLCEIQAEDTPRRPATAAGRPAPQAPAPSALPDPLYRQPTAPTEAASAQPDQFAPSVELPRQELGPSRISSRRRLSCRVGLGRAGSVRAVG